MAATAGKKLRVKVSTTAGGAGAYTVVAGIKSATRSRSGQNVDVTALTDDDIVRMQGIRDCSYSMEGNYEADTNGQGAIRNALENGSELWVQFLPDGATGWKQSVTVSKYDITGAVGDKQSVSIELEGSGTISTV